MTDKGTLPYPVLDALPLGAHRLMVLTDEALFRATGVRVAFTNREGGVSEGPYASLNCYEHVGDDDEAVARNQAIICEAVGADTSSLVFFTQVHGTRLVDLGENEGSSHAGESETTSRVIEEADGAIVRKPGIPVMLRSADCLLLAIVSPTGRFAVAHAGWRGAVAHIARLAANSLAERDDAEPSSYNAYIGPHICPNCFEVGEEVEERFKSEFGDFVVPQPRHVSLSAAVSHDLLEAGFDARRIVDANECTFCNPTRYYSYRAAGGTCGRHALLAYKQEEE
jgi:hypothetical protein